MKVMRSLVLIAAVTTLLVAQSSLAASGSYGDIANEDPVGSEEMDYDSIVDQLNKENSAQAATIRSKRNQAPGADPLDSILMHGGIGYATFVQNVRTSTGRSYSMNQRGIQAALGIDLFSPNWMAEGTARSFGEEGNSLIRSSVQEFELKVIYKQRSGKYLGFRAGAGLSGRYLTIKEAGLPEMDYTTPTSVATLGGDFFISNAVSLGADINARNSMIGETIDRNSFDATLRLDTHF